MPPFCSKKHGAALKANLICAFLAVYAGASPASGDEELSEVLATFGPGVITQTSTTATIESVTDFITSNADKRTFTIMAGDDAGGTLLFEVVQKEGELGTHFVHMGKGNIATIRYLKSSVYRSQQVDDDSGSIASFDPAEPVFLSKQGCGDKVESQISVTVSPISRPTEVSHRGDLKCTYEVLGTFQVVSPIGVFETICVRTRYRGKVGPADVDDSRYIFYAEKYGPVAIRTFSHVEAMIFYNKTKQRSLLLSEYDLVPDPVGGKSAQ